ncbi:MAG TPA: hypothetical protein VG846_15860, partial [Actinomycetota bacterium]|nr:hypothetical protein [Actinomycetota bacterium]
MSELKTRSPAFAAIAALLALVLALAGCGGDEPAAAPAPLDPSAGPGPSTTRAPRKAGVFQLGNAPAYVALAA